MCAVFFPHQLFIKSNQGDEETTKINYLTFIGTPVQATNMNDFRRVWASCNDGSFQRYCFPNALCSWFLNGRNCFCVGCGKERRESLSRGEPRERREEEEEAANTSEDRRTAPLPKLPQTLLSLSLTHPRTHTASSSPLVLWMNSLSVESRSINHLYCNSDENHCK